MPSASKAAAFIGAHHIGGNSAASISIGLSPGGLGADARRLQTGGSWGGAGWLRLSYHTASEAFSEGQIITGSVTGAKARVLRVQANIWLICERMIVTGDLVARAFRMGETITADKPTVTSTTAIVGSGVIGVAWGLGTEESVFSFNNPFPPPTISTLQSTTPLVPALMSPVLNGVFPSISNNVFWDREARRAAVLPVDDTAWVTTISRVQNAAATATALVIGIEGDGIAVSNVTGTWSIGNTVHPYGGGAALANVDGALQTTTNGEWVPYAARPNLGGMGQRWQTPPAGSDVMFRYGTVGVEPYFVKNACAQWGVDSKFYKYDSNGIGIGGAVYGVIVCSGTFPTTWELGEVLNGPSGWTGTLVAFVPDPVAGTTGWLYVRNISGTLTAGTVTGAESSASANSIGNVIGWMKGALHWEAFLADVRTSFTKLQGELIGSGFPTFAGVANVVSFTASTKIISRSSGTWGVTPTVGDRIYVRGSSLNNGWHTVTAATTTQITCGGSAIVDESASPSFAVAIHFDFDWQAVVSAPGQYDAELPNAGANSLGLDFTATVEGMRQWINDVREQFGDDVIIPAYVHHQNAGALSHAGQWNLLRIVYITIAKDDTRFRPYYADEFEAAVDSIGELAESQDRQFLETAAYPLLGKKIWETYRVGVLEQVQTDLSEAAIVLLTGQSQMVGQTSFVFWQLDNDPELGKIETGAPGGMDLESTIDIAIQMYDPVEGHWEPYSCATNAVTIGGNLGMWGPETSLLNRLKGRFGSIYCIKIPWGGASMQFHPTTTVTYAQFTRTAVTTFCALTDVFASPARGRFTAGGGEPFSAFSPGDAMEVSGASTGNNTSGFPTHSFAVVHAVDPSGNWIELLGTYSDDDVGHDTTFTKGPLDLRTTGARIIREALTRLVTEENKIPRRIGTVTWQGEGDLEATANYKAACQDHIAWCRSVFGHRVGNELPSPHVWLMLTDKTPVGTDEQVASIRAQQLQLAEDSRVSVVDTKDLPLKYEGKVWPRVTRQDYGIHHTGRATVIAGYRADKALEAFVDIIPPHPNGAALVDGVEVGQQGSGGDGGDSQVVGGDDEGGGDSLTVTSSPADIVEVIDMAIASGGDVASYMVNGRTVTMRSLDDLLKARAHYAALQARQTGLRRARAYFP